MIKFTHTHAFHHVVRQYRLTKRQINQLVPARSRKYCWAEGCVLGWGTTPVNGHTFLQIGPEGMKFFLAALLSCGIFAFAQDAPPLNFQPLNFQEVFHVVRTNLTDISEEELSRLAAQGLIK